jgi:hypothetical protein
MVNEEREAFQRYEKSLCKEEMSWRLKSRKFMAQGRG